MSLANQQFILAEENNMKRQDHLNLVFKLRTMREVNRDDKWYLKDSQWNKYHDLYARAVNLYIRKYGWSNVL